MKFNCSLSQTVTRQISISNPTDNAVKYLLLFVNNANQFFTILKPTAILHVHAHGSSQVEIQFHAKKIQKVKGKIHIPISDYPIISSTFAISIFSQKLN